MSSRSFGVLTDHLCNKAWPCQKSAQSLVKFKSGAAQVSGVPSMDTGLDTSLGGLHMEGHLAKNLCRTGHAEWRDEKSQI